MNPSWRTAVGMFAILALIAAWSVIVATAADWVAGTPWPVQALFFATAGIVWVLPLRPLLRWMQTGKWWRE